MTPPQREPSDDASLFRAYRATRDRAIRNTIVERHTGLAIHIAKRYRRPGSQEDIEQAAMIGLIKAVDRFDPDNGASFTTFAGSTIDGELKRHLRDRTWVVRVPRAAKELHLLVRRAADELHQTHGRSPTVDEIAAHVSIDRADVLRGLAASAAYEVGTIDGGADERSGPGRPIEPVTEEAGFGRVVDARTIAELLERLPEREREIVRLRFYEDKSQAEIAELVNVSQMHVSRLLRRTFETMRGWLSEEDAASA